MIRGLFAASCWCKHITVGLQVRRPGKMCQWVPRRPGVSVARAETLWHESLRYWQCRAGCLISIGAGQAPAAETRCWGLRLERGGCSKANIALESAIFRADIFGAESWQRGFGREREFFLWDRRNRVLTSRQLCKSRWFQIIGECDS